MAINKTNRLAWIVKTIYKAKKITFEELARKWKEDDRGNYEIDSIASVLPVFNIVYI